MHLSTFFPLTLLAHITNHIKSSWLSDAYCILSGGEFWQSWDAYGRLHLWNESWVNPYYISNTWVGLIHISPEWGSIYLFSSTISCACMMCFTVHWGWSSLISSLWSCTSLKTFTSTCFSNVLCTICFAIDCYSWLWYARNYLRRLLYIWVPDASPFIGFSSVYLKARNGLSMGEFDKSVKCTLFWGRFVPFSGRIMCFTLYYALHFLFCACVWIFSLFCRFLDLFPILDYDMLRTT